MGIFRLESNSQYIIERPAHESKLFTFIKDTKAEEEIKLGIKSGSAIDVTGSIVEFKYLPEKGRIDRRNRSRRDISNMRAARFASVPEEANSINLDDDDTNEKFDTKDVKNLVGGKTVLTGDSNQVLTQTYLIQDDESQATILKVHLVARLS